MIEVVILGALLGIVITISGVGAGVVTTPALIVVAGLDPLSAVATGALFSAVLKVAISAQHLRTRMMSWRDAWTFLRISVPVTVVIALATGSLYARGFSNLVNQVTTWAVIGCGMVALASLYSAWVGISIERAGRSVAAAVTGIFVGSTGVGGGIFVVPALVRAWSRCEEGSCHIDPDWLGFVLCCEYRAELKWCDGFYSGVVGGLGRGIEFATGRLVVSDYASTRCETGHQ